MKILLKNARILTMKDETIIHGDILVSGNKIVKIGEVNEEADRVIDCEGNLLMPGFKNAHAHSPMTFLRSYADDLPLKEWLFDNVFPYEENLTPEDIYHLAKVSYLEYLTSGITASFDMYYFPHALAKSSLDFGMRSLIINTYSEGKREFEELSNEYHKYNDLEESLVRIVLGTHAEYTSNEKELRELKKTINSLKSPFFSHISETKNEVEESKTRHSMTPLVYFDSLGLFAFGGGGYHCCYLTDEDIEILKKRNLTLVTCPGSNMKLASGTPKLAKALKEGINIAIGTDGPASNNSLDMWKEMYLTSCLQKLTNLDPTLLPAFEVLKMATVNGAKAMGLDNADTLEVNKLADIIMIDLKQPNMQPLNNIISNLVYAGSKSNVKMTMIDGKILYLDGKFYLKESVEEIYEAASKATKRLIDNK